MYRRIGIIAVRMGGSETSGRCWGQGAGAHYRYRGGSFVGTITIGIGIGEEDVVLLVDQAITILVRIAAIADLCGARVYIGAGIIAITTAYHERTHRP